MHDNIEYVLKDGGLANYLVFNPWTQKTRIIAGSIGEAVSLTTRSDNIKTHMKEYNLYGYIENRFDDKDFDYIDVNNAYSEYMYIKDMFVDIILLLGS